MPIPLIVIGAVILFFILLFLIRLRICITLRDEVSLVVRVLFFRISVYPRKKKIKWKKYSPKKAAKIAAKKARKEAKKEARKAAKKAAKKAKKEAEKSLPPEQKKEKTTLIEKIRLVRALSAALFRKTRKRLHLHAARLHLRIATGDAAKTAILYGVVCQSLAYLLALLDRITHLRAPRPDVDVTADFLGEKSSADVKIILSIRLGGAFSILFSVAIAFLKAKMDQKQRRKQAKKKTAAAERDETAQKGNNHG